VTREVVVLPTGTANLASVLAAFRRLGAAPRIAAAADDVQGASHAVLPGVGTFGASAKRAWWTRSPPALRRIGR